MTFYGSYRKAYVLEEWRISEIPQWRKNRAFILQQGDISETLPFLRNAGLNFPEQYILCGEVVSPYTVQRVKIWRPRGRHIETGVE